MIRLLLVPAILFCLLLVTGETTRAGCGHLFHHRAHVVHHAVVQPQVVLYSVGDALAIEAAVDRAVRKALTAVQQQQAPHHPVQQQVNSVIASKCARCHSGDEPAGGVDFRWKVDDFAFRRTVEMLGEGIDVPEKMAGVIKSLTPEEKGAITSEMMRLPARPAAAKPEPQVTIPPPEEAGVLR